jgi:hypothetical protein
MQTKFQITESGTTESGNEVDLARLFSHYNRKYIPMVDKKGNAQMFHIKLSVNNGTTNPMTCTASTASTGYATKQAVRAWHRVWRSRFKDAGISMKELGKYGQNLRLELTAADSALGSGNSETGSGEWTLSEVIAEAGAVPGASGTAPESGDLTNSYTLHLTGDHTANGDQSETYQWSKVGAIKSWLESRRSAVGPGGGDVPAGQIIEQSNPLIAARYDSTASQDLIEEVREFQAEEAPYSEATHYGLFSQALFNVAPSDTAVRMLSVPCGLLQLSFTQACTFEFELLGITDM